MKKFLSLLLVAISCFLFIDDVYAYEKVDNSLKIYDYGEFLTESDEKELKSKIDEYTEKYNLDMVIVTKKNYTGDIKAYGQDFYDYNGFGVGSTHDGILLVYEVDSQGPYAEIVTTGEGIRMYDDNRIDMILDAMSSAKSNGDAAMIKAFVERAEKYASYGIPESNANTYIDENGDLKTRYNEQETEIDIKQVKKIAIITSLILSTIFASIMLYKMISQNKMINKARDASDYLAKNSINISGREDRFIRTHTTRTRIRSESSGSGGGSHSSSGSSTSRGSSGTSHGGGGRRL